MTMLAVAAGATTLLGGVDRAGEAAEHWALDVTTAAHVTVDCAAMAPNLVVLGVVGVAVA